MLQRAARNAYSWWWASHIRTKQSKWLEDKLQDMEEKVEYILKIVDEDGDTFRQRAEMYYRKRPEIVSFIEDFFKGYRALAERYDHLSRELQSANRTIATVFPENVQLRMDDTDEFDVENLPGKLLSGKITTTPPAAPLLKISKLASFEKKKPKTPSRLMSRKGPVKIDASTRSGLEKSEAITKLDELQKGILSLQTEKEFVKYSYEHGIQRHGEIEKQITEMQVEVSKLEDEFGIGTVIEDDEARSIMTATALKSCQETLSRLQHKQKESTEDAREELEKVQNAQEKIKFLKEKHTVPSPNIGFSASEQAGSIGPDVPGDLESLRRKVKEDLKISTGNSLTMSELAEKVEELVDKIVKLESSVFSHGAYVERLRLETKELHMHIQSLEAEKHTLIEGASMNKRITEFEGELQRIQSLKQQMNEQNCLLQTGFAEASCNIEDLTDKLKTVKPDEETDIVDTTMQNFQPQESFQVNNIPNLKEQCQMPSDESVTNVSSQLKDPKMNASDFSKQMGVPEMRITSNPGLSLEDESVTNVSSQLKDPKMKASDFSKQMGVPEMRITPNPGLSIEDESVTNVLSQLKDPKMKASDFSKQMGVPEMRITPNPGLSLEDEMAAKKEEKEGYVNRGPIVSSDDREDKKGKVFVQNTVTMEEGQDSRFQKSNAGGDTGIEDEKNGAMSVQSPKPNGSIRPDSTYTEVNNMPGNSLEKISTKVPDGSTAVLNGKDNKMMMQNALQTTQTNSTADIDETVVEEDVSPNWKELCLSDLDDRGRILLEEYTSVLRNYKDARKKLTEVEKNKRASLFRYCIQIKMLESANALKDTEIQSLQKKLSLLLQDDQSKTAEIETETDKYNAAKRSLSGVDTEIESLEQKLSLLQDDQSKTAESRETETGKFNAPNEANNESDHVTEERTDLHQTKISSATNTDETCNNSSIVEERIRADIDELMDENIEFWMKFSSLLHQIRKFTTTVEDLQAEIAKVMEKKQQQNPNADHLSLVSDIRPMYRHLKEIQTELTLWLDQNVVLKDDLHNRSSSLSSLLEEINKMSKAYSTAEISGSGSGSGLINYQAAKFQGEILNMNQENNRVVQELQSGLERVKNLQVKIEKTLKEVDKEFDISNRQKSRYTAIHTRIPLRSFLFGVKLKKQKPSFFACIHPSVQRSLQ